jgi:hypothetical protein
MTTKKPATTDLAKVLATLHAANADGDVTACILAANDAEHADSTQRLAYYHHLGLFRIRAEPDTDYSFADLCGDTYNPEACPDIPPAQLAREKATFRSRVSRQGVWGFVLEVRKSSADAWGVPGEHLDSLWGNVGADFVGSGYDHDFLVNALDWLEENKVVETDPQANLIAAAKKALCGMRALIALYPEMAGDIQPYCKKLFDALDPYDMPGSMGVSVPGTLPAPVEPLLGFDGFGFNLIADQYRARVLTLDKEFKPGHPRESEGAAVLAALFASGVATKNY